jgi:hypothetical protein
MLEHPPRSQNPNATEEMAPQTPEWPTISHCVISRKRTV